MACIVQKFGGTSVATLDRILHVASLVEQTRRAGHNIAVVVSAMAGVTNRLVDYVHSMGSGEGDAEYDSVVSSGESVTSGLLAIALNKRGIPSRSYRAWQLPIITDDHFGQAIIKQVNVDSLIADMNNGITPVISGFQGITENQRITTLGRGGSDLSAVAIASALKASICEIYSDVDGVYTVDPNIYSNAKRLETINYEDMLEMAAQGAKVLQEGAVLYGMRHNTAIRVASSFVDGHGTVISADAQDREYTGMAIGYNVAQLKIAYRGNSNQIAQLLNQNFIKSTLIRDISNEITIIIDKQRLPLITDLLERQEYVQSVRQELVREHLSRITIVCSDPVEEKCANIAQFLQPNVRVFECIPANRQVNLVVPSDSLQEVVGLLHKWCGFEQ